MFITRNDEKLKFYGAGMRGGNVLGCVVGMCWDAWQECAGMRGGNVLQNACQKNGKLLGCVAGMCWDAWQECAAKCVPEIGMSLCKKCYIEPVEVRARKAGNCWDAWRECAGMHGRNVLQNVLH